MKMPSRLEADAAHTAAATLPRATEVKAIEDCTVEGRQQRKSTPVERVVGRMKAGRRVAARPSSGKSTKVAARITRCRLTQWVMPAATTESPRQLRFAQLNSRAMTSLVTSPRSVAKMPCTGRKLATPTMADDSPGR